MANHLTLYITS